MGRERFKPTRKRISILWAVAITVFASVLLFEAAEVQRTSLDAVDRINRLIVADRALVHLATTMESNLRGYLATGSPVFVGAYRQAAASTPERFDALNRLLVDEPGQKAERDRFRK